MENLAAQANTKTTPNDFTESAVYLQTKLVRIEEVSELTTLGKSTINLWVAQGKFPKPYPLSSTLKVWRFSDVAAWIEGATKGAKNA